MKSIRFPSEIHPTAPYIPDVLIDKLRTVGAWGCRNAIMEGAGSTLLSKLMQLKDALEPGESNLAPLLADTYKQISFSSLAFMSSAAPFCLSDSPTGGHYFVHVPKAANETTPVFLLFHGWGGNLLYFPWAIWKEIPNAIIIAPSWQVHWSDGDLPQRIEYVHLALSHVQKSLDFRLNKPWLIPLSQGGGMAFQLAAEEPERFKGLIGISTGADSLADVRRIDAKFPVRLIHGGADNRVECSYACDTIIELRKNGDAEITVIESANHWLLLSHRKRVGQFITDSIHELESHST